MSSCTIRQLGNKVIDTNSMCRVRPLDVKPRSLVLKNASGYAIIPFSDIIRCQADGNYSMVYTASGCQFLTCQTLKKIEKRLPVDLFVRIHQSHLVAKQYIQSINSQNGIVLINKHTVPMSRRQKKHVLASLGIK